jgi:hypothetical protein
VLFRSCHRSGWLRAGCVSIVLLLAWGGVASASQTLSAAAFKRRADVICSWGLSAYNAAAAGIGESPQKTTARQLVRYFRVDATLMRHRDSGLGALNGPVSLNRASKRLVVDTRTALSVDEAALAHFKAIPAQQAVVEAEGRSYASRAFKRAQSDAELVVAGADLPEICVPA